jgi:hypothetical protein
VQVRVSTDIALTGLLQGQVQGLEEEVRQKAR